MKNRHEKRFKAEVDRCRTEARKLNISFNEASVQVAKERMLGSPENYTPVRLELARSGDVMMRWHRK